MIGEEEFKEWLLHPVTKAVRQALEQKRDLLRRQWESGAFTDYEKEATVLTNVANMGTCRGYAFVAELDYETLIGELDDESEWASAPGSGSANPSV